MGGEGRGRGVCAPLGVSIKNDAIIQIEYTDLVNSHEGTMNWGSVLPANPSLVYLQPSHINTQSQLHMYTVRGDDQLWPGFDREINFNTYHIVPVEALTLFHCRSHMPACE